MDKKHQQDAGIMRWIAYLASARMDFPPLSDDFCGGRECCE